MRPVRHASTFVRPKFTKLIALIGAGRSPHTKKVTQRAIQQFDINPNKHHMSPMEIQVVEELSSLGKVWPSWSSYADIQTIGDLKIVRNAQFQVFVVHGPEDSKLKIPIDFIDETIKCPITMYGGHIGCVPPQMREDMFTQKLLDMILNSYCNGIGRETITHLADTHPLA